MAHPPRSDSAKTDARIGRLAARYALPILLIALAGSLRFLFPTVVSREIFLLALTLAVFLSARFSGLGPGLLSTLLGAALEWRLSPYSAWSPALLFVPAGVVVSFLTTTVRSAVQRGMERQRRETLDTVPTFVALLGRDGIVIDVNNAALVTASLSRQDVVGKRFHEVYWWSHSAELQQRLQAALGACAAGQAVLVEGTLRQDAGRFLPVEISLCLRGEFIMATAHDISRRIADQRAIDSLQERVERSESALGSAQKAAGVATFDWLLQNGEIAWSDELRTLFGIEGPEDQPEDWRTLLDPDDRDNVEREVKRLLRNRERDYKFEFRVTPPKGSTKWLLSAGSILELPDKRYRMLGVILDLTRSKQLESAVRESEARYNRLMYNLPAIVFIARPDGHWDYVSVAWMRYTGITPAQAADYGWSSALHPEDAQTVLYRWMNAIEGAEPFTSECRIRSAGGEYRWFFVTAAPVRDDHGRLVQWFGAASDIDSQKRVEIAARSGQKWYERAHEASGIGLFEWELETGRFRCSDEWLRLYPVQPTPTMRLDDWIGSIHSDDRERVREELRRCCVESGCREFEYRVAAPDAAIHWMSTRAKAYVDDDGNPLRVIGASMDATERKRLEEALRGKQKLESIGVLAGGIAHDFNNLLAAIMGHSSLLLERLSSVGPSIEDILSASNRAADLTRQMLAFAGKGYFQTEPVNLSDLVREIARSVGPSVPKNIQLQLEMAPDLPAADADPNQLRLVLTSLINNAMEAIGEEKPGTIALRTSVRHESTEAVDVAPGYYVCLEVRDTGCGMDETTKSRVFDPFFTTKFQGRGLGLSAALGIIRGHKGALRVASAPGRGSTFTVLLPVSSSVPDYKTQPEISEQPGRSVKILVVDDEPVVRNLVRAVLERYGYSVLLAEDGEKGLEQFARNQSEIELTLLDVAMPGLSCEETLRRLRAIRPDSKVLLFSGYGAEDALRRFEGQDVSGFLQKPFAAQTLAERVRAVLSGDTNSISKVPLLVRPNDAPHNHYPA